MSRHGIWRSRSLIARIALLAVVVGTLGAVAVDAPEAAAASAMAKNAPTPTPGPLVEGARPNRGLPLDVEPVREPPRGRPAGEPVSAARGRALDRQEGVEQLAPEQEIGPLAAASAVLLRPGYLLGDTSLIVYFNAADFEDDPIAWTRWYATVTDVETGVEQRSVFFARNDIGQCGRPRQFCRTFGATDGWVLVDGREYTATVTVERPGGVLEESAPSNTAQAREVIVPPGVPAAQASGCSCPNVLTRAPGLQALRGNLVNTATGAMVRTEADLSMTSFGVPFEATRIYASSNPFQGMFGAGWSWTYDARVISDQGPDVRLHAEDGQGGFTRPAGVQSRLARAGSGWELTTADRRELRFDGQGRLVSVLNRRGDGVTLGYAGDGRLATVTDAAGRVVQVDMDPATKRIRSLTLPDRRAVSYTYGDGGRLVAVRDARGGQWRYAYTGDGRLESVTDPLNRVVVRSAYDTGGRVTSQTNALGAVTRFSWTPGVGGAEDVSLTVDPDGVRVADRYLRNVLLQTTIGPEAVDPDTEGGTLTFRYNGRLHRNLTVDEQANQSTVTFDDDGNALRTRAPDPSAYTEVNEFDTRNNLIRHVDRRGKEWTYTYNAQNEMTGQADPTQGDARQEQGYRYSYDGRGLIESRRDPRGEVTRYEYDAAGNRTAEITPTGRRTEFEYDATGRRVAIVDPRGTAPGTPAGTRARYTTRTVYDAEDRPVRVQEPGNLLATMWEFDAAGQLVSRADPLRRTERFRYDAAGRLDQEIDARGNASRSTYTAAGRSLTSTDAVGNRVSWTYNARGQVLTETTPRGNSLADRGGTAEDVAPYRTRFRYDQRGNRTASERVMPDGVVSRVQTEFDELSRPTGQIDELTRRTGAEYDEQGNLIELVDERGQRLRQVFDDAGRRTSANDPDAAEGPGAPRGGGTADRGAEIEYDEIGNPTRQITATGGEIRWQYDADGRPAGITEPRGFLSGNSPGDFTTTFGYDPAGNLSSVRDPLGNTTRAEYDPQNRVVATTDAGGAITRYAFDDADQVQAVAGPVKGQLSDTLSRWFTDQVSRVSGRGPVNGTIFTLTGLNAPVTFAFGQLTGVPITRYGYDLNGNAVVMGDQLGRIRRTLYDDLDRPSATADPLGRARAYGYDADSNLTTVQTASNVPGLALNDSARAARTMTHTYDPLNRLIRRQLGAADGGGPVYTYGYDVNDRLISAADPDGTSAFSYERTSLLETVSRNGREFAYEYDDNDNVTKRTYPDGTVVDATYDEGDRMDTLTTTRQGSSQRFSFGYDVADRLIRTTYPGSTGAVETRGYDRAGRLSTVEANSSGGVRTGYTLTRDEVGNPTRIATARRTGTGQPLVEEIRSYSYDASQRLTAACYGVTTCGGLLGDRSPERWDYGYDLVGNRTSEQYSVNSGRLQDLAKKRITSYVYDEADQLKLRTTIGAGAGIVPFEYDGEGNQTRSGSERYTYHLDHTLATASVGGQTTRFAHDAMGQRVSATSGVGTAVTTRTWDWDMVNGLPMLASETGGGLGSRAYTYGMDGAQLGMYTGEGAAGSVYTHDWLGGTAAVLGPNGSGQWAYDYDPFGNPRGPTAGSQAGITDGGVRLTATAPANPLQFAGGYNDAVNDARGGNYHLRARDYDPRNGRFTGTDPVGRPAGSPNSSSYSYVDGRASFGVDPSGLISPDTFDAMNASRAERGLPPLTATVVDGTIQVGEPEPTPPPDLAETEEPIDRDPLKAQREAAQKAVAEAENFTRQLGDEIIGLVADLIGITDARNCFTNGDIGACINTALSAVPWGKLFKAAKVAIKAVGLGRRLIEGFSRLKSARAALETVVKQADEAAAAAENRAKVQEAARKAAAAAAKAKAEAEAARRAATEAKNKAAEAAQAARTRQQQIRDLRSQGCKGNSFIAGTRVVMADGSTRAIEDVEAGDSVLAAPENGPSAGEPEPRQVTATITGHGEKQLVDLQLLGAGSGGGGPPAGRSTITATTGHPMYVSGTGWVHAGDLKPGQHLVAGDGTRIIIAAVRNRTITATVHNLTVDDRHTYYVSATTGATALTHNTAANTCSLGGNNTVPGPNGALRDKSSGRFAENPAKPAATSSSTHGNARSSTAVTTLYRLEDLQGNLLKWGITSNIKGRYTQGFLADKNLVPMTRGTRDHMLNLERWIVERDPGPLNFERWAGAAG